jgi:hypothetical protein
MARRKNRKSIVYRPKGKGKRKGKARATNGQDEEIVPSGRAWNQMHLFGAFSSMFLFGSPHLKKKKPFSSY